jgi:hypothetical protein
MHLERMAAGTYASKPLERRICVCSVSKAGDKNMYVIRVMKALTKVSRQMPGSFCYTYACLSSDPNAFFGSRAQSFSLLKKGIFSLKREIVYYNSKNSCRIELECLLLMITVIL